MNRRRPALPIAALLALTLAAAPASQPAASPAAPSDDLISLGNDLVRLHAPPGDTWSVQPTPHANPNQLMFATADKRSAMQFALASSDYPLTASNGGQVATSLAKGLKEKRQKDGRQMVLPPTVEHDRRFEVFIHEKFKIGDTTVESIQLQKVVGPRTVMVVASSGSDDPAVAAAYMDAAKDALASAKYNPPGRAKPKPSTPTRLPPHE